MTDIIIGIVVVVIIASAMAYIIKAKKSGADEVAKQIRAMFKEDWRKIKKQKIQGIPKEREAYFNSFYIADWWMNLYMKGYWKCLSLKRKLKLI